VSTSTGDGRHSRSRSVRQQRILPAAAIRSLPKGQALVWLTGSKVAMVQTLPWYDGPRAAEIAARMKTAQDRTTALATTTAAGGGLADSGLTGRALSRRDRS